MSNPIAESDLISQALPVQSHSFDMLQVAGLTMINNFLQDHIPVPYI